MKRENRNCNMPYPIYPPYQGLGPIPGPYQGMMFNQPVPFTSTNSVSSNTIEQQINNLNEQITLLDKRVTALESGNLSTNNYSSSNYQMM